MRIYQAEDYEGMSRKAANLISAQMLSKPASVLGLATGSTPVGTYKQLIEWYQRGDLDFSEIHSVNLDEYRGLAPTHDQSYRYFMQANLFDHVNINPEHTNVPDGLAEDAQAECCRYALTMGIRCIMQARKVLVVASGEDKAEIVCRAFSGPVTPEVPASILQLHPDFTLVGDRAALSRLMQVTG